MNIFQALMTALKPQVLPTIIGPIETFLAAVKPVNGQPVSVLTYVAARLQLGTALLAAGPQVLGATEADVITILQADLAGLGSTTPAPTTPVTG